MSKDLTRWSGNFDLSATGVLTSLFVMTAVLLPLGCDGERKE
ncbi:MAG TPA: hypothetical protein VMA33_02255 [Candidatus Tectomicrobia bacterium]|nr:hypothetical protein [Candidatus Tectomicrobia bacterium]